MGGDEPMEDDDSFYKPVPFSAPYVKLATQTQPVKKDSDPDSDDSFDNFPATQSTASASAKSTASSTQSAEPKVQTIRKPVFPSSKSQLIEIRPPSSISFPRFAGGPSRVPAKAQIIPVVHPALERTVGTAKRSSATTPPSPNSLARHRSANSGLRNANNNTPPVRTNIFATKMSPNDTRPATPSGEAKMLKDMLDNERLKVQKMQNDFRNDTTKNAENYRRELTRRDTLIKEKEKEIEMLKSSLACQRTTPAFSVKTPRIPTRSPVIPIPSLMNMPSCSKPEVRKVYPKLPTNLKRTPHRPSYFPGSALTAFRHASKEEEEDTFQLDASFEPSATSTPKLGGPIRIGLRRPLNLDEPLEEVNRGAPTAKKKPRIIGPRRVKKSREEMAKMAEKVWKRLNCDQNTFRKLYPNEEKVEVKEYHDPSKWIDEHLSEKVGYLNLQKEDDEQMSTAKTKAKLMQQAEVAPLPSITCKICGIDNRALPKKETTKREKEWETLEAERVSLAKRGVVEMRNRQYSELIHSVHRRGIEGFESLSQMKDLVERQYKEKMSRVQKRTLTEAKEEKKELWREAMMDELRRHGEVHANLEVLNEGRREDYLWTSESEDEDWQFSDPYNKQKRLLCVDCADRQKIQRRTMKRERERRKLKASCLKQYDMERREQVRNMSILTKSTMDAAENELNRHVDEMLASSRFMEDEDEF